MPSDTLYVIERRLVDSTVVVGSNTVTVLRDTTVGGRTQKLSDPGSGVRVLTLRPAHGVQLERRASPQHL